jgi:hypothetical protein
MSFTQRHNDLVAILSQHVCNKYLIELIIDYSKPRYAYNIHRALATKRKNLIFILSKYVCNKYLIELIIDYSKPRCNSCGKALDSTKEICALTGQFFTVCISCADKKFREHRV